MSANLSGLFVETSGTVAIGMNQDAANAILTGSEITASGYVSGALLWPALWANDMATSALLHINEERLPASVARRYTISNAELISAARRCNSTIESYRRGQLLRPR